MYILLSRQSPLPQVPHIRFTPHSSGLLDCVHTGVCGPIDKASVGGAGYFVLSKDEHSDWGGKVYRDA